MLPLENAIRIPNQGLFPLHNLANSFQTRPFLDQDLKLVEVNVAVPTPPPHGGEDAVVFLLAAGFLLHIKSGTPNHRITGSNTGMGKTVLIFFLDNLCSVFIDSDTGTERCEAADGCPRRVCHGMQPIDHELTSSSASHANRSRRSKVGCQMSSDEIVYRYAQPLRNAQYTPTNKEMKRRSHPSHWCLVWNRNLQCTSCPRYHRMKVHVGA